MCAKWRTNTFSPRASSAVLVLHCWLFLFNHFYTLFLRMMTATLSLTSRNIESFCEWWNFDGKSSSLDSSQGHAMTSALC